MSNLADFGIRAGGDTPAASESFETMYGAATAGALGGAAKESFDAVRILKASDPGKRTPDNGADYPKSPFGNALKQIAQLIKADVGLEVAFTDVGGWDTHAGEGGAQGQLSNRLRDYGQAIAAFAKDLGSRMADVTLVTMSEFGRTVKENGNRGTDHGHANVMLVLGGGVKGGRVYGRWPGLDSSHLYENRDLAVTTDFRDVFAEILQKHMRVLDLRPIFQVTASTRRTTPHHRLIADPTRGVSSALRPVDQYDIGVLAIAVENDLLAVGRNVETPRDDLAAQVRQLALLTGRQIEQREVLLPQHALRYDHTLPVGQKPVPISRVPHPDFRQRKGPPVWRNALEPDRRRTLAFGVEDEAPVGRPNRIGDDGAPSVDQTNRRSAIHRHFEQRVFLVFPSGDGDPLPVRDQDGAPRTSRDHATRRTSAPSEVIR
jgi:hypothetical protein